MSEDKQEWFLAERTRALAMIHLTRREDLLVKPAGRETGMDLLVTLTKGKEEPSLRQFGVFLRGGKTAVTEGPLDRLLRPALLFCLRIGPFPYPVCLFYFSMDDDQGYYTWLAEPAIPEAEPRLLIHNVPHCQKLDRAALDHLVRQVDQWYDAFFGRITVKAS